MLATWRVYAIISGIEVEHVIELSHWEESECVQSLAWVQGVSLSEKNWKKSVLIFNRATYLTVLDENDKLLVQAWNKKRLVSSFISWNGVSTNWTLTWAHQKSKSQPVEQAKKQYPVPKYKIQKIADKYHEGNFSINILFLPVAHPEFNPIAIV